MENVKEIIAKNLVELRKKHKLTQQALAEKLNYTDKAISRWEHAETLPDVETLCRVCDIYGVKFEYLLQKEQPKTNNPNLQRSTVGSRVVITIISACTVWLIATVLYAFLSSPRAWTVFLWALPATSLVLWVCSLCFFGSKVFRIIAFSFLDWTLVTALYVELLVSYKNNVWALFLVAVPVQAIIVLAENIRTQRRGGEE